MEMYKNLEMVNLLQIEDKMNLKILTIQEIEAIFTKKVGRPRKNALQVKKSVDLSEISKGDIVKSIGGHGPYYEGSKGRSYKGTYGLLKVDEVLPNGFYAYKVSKRDYKVNDTARQFVYMGMPEKVDLINREPHKIIKV